MTKIAFLDVKLRSLALPPKGQKTYGDEGLPAFGLRLSQGGTKTFVVGHQNSLITIGRFGIISLADARAKAKQFMAERTLGKILPRALNYSAAMQEFFDDKQRSRRPRTIQPLRERLTQHFAFKGQLRDFSHSEAVRRLKKIPTNSE